MISELLDTIMDISGLNQESGKDLRTLYNTYQAAIDSLSNLDCPVNYWDFMLVHIFVRKLDKQTRKAWEFSLDSQKEYPSFKTLQKFIIDRIDALETFSQHTQNQKSFSGNNNVKTARADMTTSNNTKSSKCVLCNENHQLAYCLKFKELSLEQRFDLIKKHKHCFNCLKFGHAPKDCNNKYNCFKCNKRHHTLLHDDKFQSQRFKRESFKPPTETCNTFALNEPGTSSETEKTMKSICHLTRGVSTSHHATFMGTVKILVRSSNGRTKLVCAMIDRCSDRSIMSESLAQQLRLSRRRVETVLEGVGGNYLTTSKSEVFVRIESRFNSTTQVEVNALVCQEVSNHKPPKLDGQSIESWTHLQNLKLSDPDPVSQEKIELILGADVYVDIILIGLKKGPKGTPAAQETIFGWILVGCVTLVTELVPKSISVMHCCAVDKLNTTIAQFWKSEDIPQKTPLTFDEQKCEKHFAETHSRDDSGQYVVRLPFKDGPPINIGATYENARLQFLSIENRLAKNPQAQTLWRKFMEDYQTLNHLEEIPEYQSNPLTNNNQYVYIPHHYIMRESSSTTPLRVVFNASNLSTNGTSLNSHLLAGPKLQIELPIIIMRWRLHRLVFTADVTKMYRQILIDKRDTDYQRIILRLDPNDPLLQKRLLTVTYGTTSAPYQALKVMQQLANDEQSRFPIGSKVLTENFYVDDAAFGADNVESALEAKNQLIEILKLGGFTLNKWISNDPILINQNEQTSKAFLPADETKSIKILGIVWDPKKDSLNIQINLTFEKNPTKRSVLSTIARMYDPMGFLNPVTTRAKIMMQKLWLMGLDWNDPLPIEFKENWFQYCKDLCTIKNISIPRWAHVTSSKSNIQIHGFADASQDAYAAVVYLVVANDNNINVTLMYAKSRVTPLKSNTLPIPKLELNAAALLSRGIQYVQNAIHMESVPVYAWSDSMIVLSWLKKPPSRSEIFVNNRIGDIFSRIPKANWNYINTLENPADCASRGLSPSELKHHSLW